MLPYLMCEDDEVTDIDFQIGPSDSLLRKKVKMQALLLEQFWTRWKREYLTSLKEFHRITGNNKQKITIGDVVLIHDETPRVCWKLAIVKKVNKGRDGLIRSAVIQTGNGITNRPITKLYPLEIRSESQPDIEQQDTDDVNECDDDDDTSDDDDDTSNTVMTQPSARSTVREAATKARQLLCEWAQILGVPPEDVEAD